MGITALRNAGDALQQEEEEAMAEMSSDPSFPKVLTAGRALARGEGYGGFLGHSLRPNADLGQTVAEEIRRGADFIKVIVSGAVDFSRSAVEGPYFSDLSSRKWWRLLLRLEFLWLRMPMDQSPLVPLCGRVCPPLNTGYCWMTGVWRRCAPTGPPGSPR